MIKVLTVDDDARFRRHIAGILAPEPDIEVVGEAVDGEDAIHQTKALKPDLVLMDVRMPVKNGLEATTLLKTEMPGVKVIISTLYDLDEYREAAMGAGAIDYIVKKSVTEQLVVALRRAKKRIGTGKDGLPEDIQSIP